MCLTCVYQQSSNTGCIVLVISPVSSTILLDITIERCLSLTVNGTYILYKFDKRNDKERSLKYAVKKFVVEWMPLFLLHSLTYELFLFFCYYFWMFIYINNINSDCCHIMH